ncbi:hypothetical protein BV20DRAFT_676098 [Pilatotrama ljubarskyi]|nr:hypothetical protein BV20DRAFT_676098 [Pilatotrama ljubarskyi]
MIAPGILIPGSLCLRRHCSLRGRAASFISPGLSNRLSMVYTSESKSGVDSPDCSRPAIGIRQRLLLWASKVQVDTSLLTAPVQGEGLYKTAAAQQPAHNERLSTTHFIDITETSRFLPHHTRQRCRTPLPPPCLHLSSRTVGRPRRPPVLPPGRPRRASSVRPPPHPRPSSSSQHVADLAEQRRTRSLR